MTAPIVPLPEVLAAHPRPYGHGSNLGQYRIEWLCDCGQSLISDGHRGITMADAHRAHLAAVLEAYVAAATEVAKVEAWDEGFMNAAGQDHPSWPRTRRIDNPYRTAPTTEEERP